MNTNWHVRIPDKSTKDAVLRFAKAEDRALSNALRQLIRDGLAVRGVVADPRLD